MPAHSASVNDYVRTRTTAHAPPHVHTHLCDAGTFHLETLEIPVTGRNGAREGVGDGVLADALEDVELGRPVLLRQHGVGLALELGVELLEGVFEQQRKQRAGPGASERAKARMNEKEKRTKTKKERRGAAAYNSSRLLP